jgi:dTDP-4-amino-4,6-dideoxygalactose transaminase
MKPKIKYASPHILEEDIQAVAEVLRSGTLTQGKVTHEYEKEIAKYVGSRYAVAFNSATSGLIASYSCLGWGPDTQVTLPPISFVATANAAKSLGCRLVFQDRSRIVGDNVVPVHYSGRPVEYYGNNSVVEDAAHALGTRKDGKMVGSCTESDICVFSTHAIKNITTGEGGIATTNHKELYEYLKMFRNHGRNETGCVFLGFNLRITDFQAALGLSQLKRINAMRDQRQEVFDYYGTVLKGYAVLPEPREEATFWHLYPIRLETMVQRDKLRSYLSRRGVETQIHYRPIYLEPYYQSLGFEKGLCPKAEAFWETELSLPIHCNLTKKDVEYVTDNIRRWVGKHAS